MPLVCCEICVMSSGLQTVFLVLKLSMHSEIGFSWVRLWFSSCSGDLGTFELEITVCISQWIFDSIFLASWGALCDKRIGAHHLGLLVWTPLIFTCSSVSWVFVLIIALISQQVSIVWIATFDSLTNFVTLPVANACPKLPLGELLVRRVWLWISYSAALWHSFSWQCTNLVDPASSHMLVSKIKPCMSQYKLLYGETANGSLKQL